MAKETLTLALEGEVTLDEFAKAIGYLNLLLNQLNKEVSKNADVTWFIDEMYAGSAVATFRGVNGDLSEVENIVNAYENVGDSLQTGRQFSYSQKAEGYAHDLISIIDHGITSVRFETSEKDFIIASRPTANMQEPQIKYAWGSVKGKIETLSERKKLSFTLWDSFYDKPVSCYFKEDQKDAMRNAWGKRAIVSGKIGRRTETGRPIVIREMSRVRLLDDVEPGGYIKAKGVFPWTPNSELPENTLGRLRSA